MKTGACKIIFIGMSGVGKSFYGNKTADFFQKPFYDTDQLIKERYGESVEEMINRCGESRFRDLEEKVFKDILTNRDMVLSTGGGIVVREKNRILLKKEEMVIYLKSDPEAIAHHLTFDEVRRPLLDYRALSKSISALMIQREKWYSECADVVIETNRYSAEEVMRRIVQLLL